MEIELLELLFVRLSASGHFYVHTRTGDLIKSELMRDVWETISNELRKKVHFCISRNGSGGE